MVAGEVFLDTAFAIALTNKTDAAHPEAAALARRIHAERIRMVTTLAIVFAREANIEGPPDWSERVDHYLYGTSFDD